MQNFLGTIGCVSMFVTIIGLIVSVVLPGNRRGDFRLQTLPQRLDALRVPVGSIREARDGMVAFVGHAVVDSGLAPAAVYAPISGRPALWLRCTVIQEVTTGRSREWTQLAVVNAGSDVRVVDPSGASAVIAASKCTSYGMEQVVFVGRLADFTPQVNALFTQLRVPPPANAHRVYRIEEEIIQPDQSVYCIGIARRAGPTPNDTLFVDESVLLTKQTPAAFAQSTRREARREKAQKWAVGVAVGGFVASIVSFGITALLKM